MQQMASDIFVRILRGMGACRKKPAQPASGSQLDDSIGNTPTTVSWRVWGYEVGLGWRLASSGISLPNNVFSWLLSDFTGPFSRPKNPSKTCAPQGASPEGNHNVPSTIYIVPMQTGTQVFSQRNAREAVSSAGVHLQNSAKHLVSQL